MSRLAGPSCKSILYCKPEQPPPTTATRNTPFARPCFVSNVETFCAALAVSLTRRSSPVRKFGAAAGLLARLAIIFDSHQCSCLHRQGQRMLQHPCLSASIRGLFFARETDFVERQRF